MSHNPSNVARLRQQLEAATEAVQRARQDYAAVARHQSITIRMQQGAAYLLHLVAQGRDAEAQALMESDWWVLDEHETTGPDQA